MDNELSISGRTIALSGHNFMKEYARRRRAKFVPGDTAAKVVQTKEPDHKDDFDEWLARIICYAFSVPPQWAVKLMNRATADNQSAQSEDEGLEPTKEWVKDLIDEIIADEFSSPDLELAWLDEDEGDPKGVEAVLESRVKIGAVTLNEMRDSLGLDPYANAAADRPMVLTATGYVPIEANAGGEGPNAPSAPFVQKYSADQPRVPVGNPDGGQWTSEGSFGRQYASATPVLIDAQALTGISRVDDTTKKLANILADVVDKVGPTHLAPWIYGTLVHTRLAAAVRAASLPGVEFVDVERTFGSSPGAPYGSKGSVRTDVLLRGDAGDIIAIYDVKTGDAKLDLSRVAKLRSMTGAAPGTYVFEMQVSRGVRVVSSADMNGAA